MRTLDLDALHLDKGRHDSPDDGMSLMEAVAYVAGEPHSDRPGCVSPILAGFGRSINNVFPDARRQELKRFLPLLPGTASDGLDEVRGYLALDWLVRTYTPAWLDLAGLTVEAGELRGLREIVDLAAAQAVGPVVRASAEKATAAWDAAAAGAAARVAGVAALAAAGVAALAAARDAGVAAWDAAWDAALAAARDAGWDAARDAARAAALDAALDAALAAARAAAAVAGWDALQPTIDMLQASAIDLYDRMIHARTNQH